MDPLVISELTFYGAALSAVVGLVWFMASQFNGVKKLCYEIKDQILTKLEYHERHDDVRFQTLSNAIQGVRDELWEIRLRNATIDGTEIGRLKIANVQTKD